MPVGSDKIAAIRERLKALGVAESDLEEDFIRGSGAGGQKINKTSSCVQLTYLPKNWVIRCQESRSRELNRFLALRKLLEKLEDEKLGRASLKAQKIHKIRAQKRKRSRRAKDKLLQDKSHQSKKKQSRGRVRSDD